MDFDTEFQRITDSLKEMDLPLSDFQRINSLLYQAYNLGKVEECTVAMEHVKNATEFMDIGLKSALNQLAFNKHAELRPMFK